MKYKDRGISKYIKDVAAENSDESKAKTKMALVLVIVTILEVCHLVYILFQRLESLGIHGISKSHGGAVLFLVATIFGLPALVFSLPSKKRVKISLIILLLASLFYFPGVISGLSFIYI